MTEATDSRSQMRCTSTSHFSLFGPPQCNTPSYITVHIPLSPEQFQQFLCNNEPVLPNP